MKSIGLDGWQESRTRPIEDGGHYEDCRKHRKVEAGSVLVVEVVELGTHRVERFRNSLGLRS